MRRYLIRYVHDAGLTSQYFRDLERVRHTVFLPEEALLMDKRAADQWMRINRSYPQGPWKSHVEDPVT